MYASCLAASTSQSSSAARVTLPPAVQAGARLTRTPARLVNRTIVTMSSRRAHGVCPQCGHHFPLRAHERIAQLADAGSFVEDDANLRSADPLTFFDVKAYSDRLADAETTTGLGDALVSGSAKIERRSCRLAVMDFAFMGGSMGERRRREVLARVRAISERSAPTGLRDCVWGCAHAGGNSLAHANAKDRLRR